MLRNSFILSTVGVYLVISDYYTATLAEIIPYNQHYVVPLNTEFLTIPKFSPTDAPHWAPGRGRSYIDLSGITLHNDCKSDILPPPGIDPAPELGCRNSTFDILMFEEPTEQYWKNYWPENQFCCTWDMVTEGE